MRMLYLDDFRNPIDSYHTMKDTIYLSGKWNIVRNYNEFKQYIEDNGIPDIVSFDHDLADEHYTPAEYWDHYEASEEYQNQRYPEYKEKTGYDCLMFLLEHVLNPDARVNIIPSILIHTANPVGRDKMKAAINSFNRYIDMATEPMDRGDEDDFPEDH